ncbi:hypothetical protein Sjap_008331 [Stephania japonica]|uniref:Uncharacterized protein n=1 Tax=Stephania japonica TaxID=461633 RepID=A0AAP0PB87_9MAGN
MKLDKWTLRKGVNDMKRWMEKSKASNQLMELLSKTPPTQQADSLLHLLKVQYDLKMPGYQVSSLSVVPLVGIATISMPSSLSASLSGALNEVFEVLQFVGRKISTLSFENKNKYVLCKSIAGREITESSTDDCEETVKVALKVLTKVEPLEPLVRWSFPTGSTITHLTSNELSTIS